MSKQLFEDSLLFGSNAPFLEDMYEEYLHNPVSVTSAWREYFDSVYQRVAHVATECYIEYAVTYLNLVGHHASSSVPKNG